MADAVLSSGCLKRFSRFDNTVADHEEFAFTGNECRLLGFAFGDEFFVERFYGWVVANRHQSRQVEELSHMCAASFRDSGLAVH